MIEGYKDAAPAARSASVALYAYMSLSVASAVLSLSAPAPDPGEGVPSLGDLVAIPAFLALLACFVLVGRWIYRANANAHCLSTDMTISPGWAVGWFFIPFANLVMPYQAMKEAWRESQEAAGQFEEVESPLLPWWWGLWIATNVVANLSFMLGGRSPDALEAVPWIDLVHAFLDIAAGLVLIQIMKRLSRAQDLAVRANAFL
jgi:hypothetical protein